MMQWYVTFSICNCATLFVAILGQLCLSSFLLWKSDESPPLALSDEWLINVIALIPVSVVVMFFSLFVLWILLSKNKIRFFIAALVGNFLLLLVMVYFAVIFAIQFDSPPASGESLFKNTKTAIAKKATETSDPHFIFKWLDTVQKDSKECCGVETFRDWEQFWPDLKTEVPKSCCKEPDGGAEKCPVDLGSLPWPGTPSMFIKTDTGCIDEINHKVRNNIHQTFVYAVIIVCLMAIAQIAYLIQFYEQYIPLSKQQSTPSSDDPPPTNDQDNNDTNKNPPFPDPYASGGGGSGNFSDYGGYSGSLQGSTGSLGSDGMSTDMGDFGGVPLNPYGSQMTSADKQRGGLSGSRTASNSALPRMMSLGKVNNPQENNLLPTGSSSSSELDDIDNTTAGLNADGSKKKRKKKKKKKSGDEGTGTMDSSVNRQQVFMSPPSGADDFNSSMDEALFSGSSVSPNASMDEVGDLLPDQMPPPPSSKKKNKFGIGLGRKHH